MTSSKQLIPWYKKLWNSFKQFPQYLAQGAKQNPTVSGPAAAAFISASFSCFILMINQHLTIMFPSWNQIIWDLGLWMPGSKTGDPYYGEIGSYSGQETLFLISWLGSWLFLNQLWKEKQVKSKIIFMCLFYFMLIATLMNWHPLFPYLPLVPSS